VVGAAGGSGAEPSNEGWARALIDSAQRHPLSGAPVLTRCADVARLAACRAGLRCATPMHEAAALRFVEEMVTIRGGEVLNATFAGPDGRLSTAAPTYLFPGARLDFAVEPAQLDHAAFLLHDCYQRNLSSAADQARGAAERKARAPAPAEAPCPPPPPPPPPPPRPPLA